jgi:mono/diheme cytochrome c family protein
MKLNNNTIMLNILQQILPARGIVFLICCWLALCFSSCDRSRNQRGYEYFPDMAHSPAYKTYSQNDAMEDGMTMRIPVAGTVPRHIIPYPFAADFEGRDQAGRELFNPLVADEQTIEQGRELYNIFCFNCHGEIGDGQGNLFTTGRYIIPPASLLTDEVRDLPQGEVFHVITQGWGVMGPHGPLIQPEDRWKIVTFMETVFHGR